MKILITGCAGFIGFSTVKKLLTNKNILVTGVDSLNDYYSVKLKNLRLNRLRKFENFDFKKVDINNKSKMEEIFRENNFQLVINLAAQAGVRLDTSKYQNYFDSNIQGFFNIIDLCNKFSVKKLIYASSSSVYGGLKKDIFSEDNNISLQKSFYSTSKLINENIASFYSENFGIKSIGLRFFTVYGDYGRPDMAYFLFALNILKSRKIVLFNNGNMRRDMTHISDIVEGIFGSIDYIDRMKSNHEIFNLGNNKPVNTKFLLNTLEDKLGKKAIFEAQNSELEVLSTHADLKKSMKFLGYKPKVELDDGLTMFVNWLKKYIDKI